MKTCVALIFFSFLLISKHFNQCSSIQEDKFHLKINQTITGAFMQYRYTLSDNKFEIYRTILTKKGREKTRLIYSNKLSSESFFLIKNRSEELFKLKNNYLKAELGGIYWDISLILDNKSKTIAIENVSIPLIDSLFNAINKIVPEKYPKIYIY